MDVLRRSVRSHHTKLQGYYRVEREKNYGIVADRSPVLATLAFASAATTCSPSHLDFIFSLQLARTPDRNEHTPKLP